MIRKFIDILLRLQALHTQRRGLSDLDDALLRDIGLTRYEADREARRSIWDAPDHWKRPDNRHATVSLARLRLAH